MVADAMSALAEKSAFIAFVHASVSSGVWVLLLVGVGVPEQELAATELGRCCGRANRQGAGEKCGGREGAAKEASASSG